MTFLSAIRQPLNCILRMMIQIEYYYYGFWPKTFMVSTQSYFVKFHRGTFSTWSFKTTQQTWQYSTNLFFLKLWPFLRSVYRFIPESSIFRYLDESRESLQKNTANSRGSTTSLYQLLYSDFFLLAISRLQNLEVGRCFRELGCIFVLKSFLAMKWVLNAGLILFWFIIR